MHRSSARRRSAGLSALGAGLLAALLLLAPLCTVPAEAAPTMPGGHHGAMAHAGHGPAVSNAGEHEHDCRPDSCCVAVATRPAKTDSELASVSSATAPAIIPADLAPRGPSVGPAPEARPGWQPGSSPLRL